MRTLKLLALSAVLSLGVLSTSTAKAGLLLEPYLGYELGKLDYTGTPSSSADLSSVALGARVAFTLPVLFVGVDYGLPIGGTLKDSSGNKADVSGSQLFAIVGASLPLVRAYVGYGLMTSLESKFSNVTTKYEGGTAFKLGVGTTLFPLTAINLEYINTTYDKVGGVTTSNYKSGFFMLNVSIPFQI